MAVAFGLLLSLLIAITELELFQEIQLELNFHEISFYRDHWLRFVTSGASHFLTIPSAEHVATSDPYA